MAGRQNNALIWGLYDSPIWKDALQFALFGLLPGSIRRSIRGRNSTPATEEPTTNADVWYRDRVFMSVLGVIALAVVISGDWYMRNIELKNLVSEIEASETAMKEFNAAQSTVVETAWKKELTASQSRTVLAAAAGDSNGKLIDSRDRIESVNVFPWHRSIVDARSDYLDHMDAWQKSLEAWADTSRQVPQDGSISGTFAVFNRSMHDAVPPFALANVDRRVDAIFAG
jgi:hypothetical protein